MSLPWTQRCLAAMQSAEETLRDLGIDSSDPVDVYAAIEDLGLWLVFRPLGDLLGAIVPHGSGGVLVTSQRGPGLQRFTAAHEIGHWVMDHDELALDSEADVLRSRDSNRERAAQIFAAYFLMPPPLVFSTLGRLGINPEQLRPAEVYRLARDMHSSYEATARHLTNMRLLNAADRDAVLATGRAGAKAQLTGGRAAAGEVWDIDPSHAGTIVSVAPGDEVVVALPENPSTGYAWTLPYEVNQPVEAAPPPPLAADCPELDEVAEPEPTPASQRQAVLRSLPSPAARQVPPASGQSAFSVVADAYVPSWATPAQARRPDSTRRHRHDDQTGTPDAGDRAVAPAANIRLGGIGTRLMALRADRAGSWRILLDYNRPFEPDSSQGTFEVLARVLPPDPQPYDITDGITDGTADR